jgi:hypothetical protein
MTETGSLERFRVWNFGHLNLFRLPVKAGPRPGDFGFRLPVGPTARDIRIFAPELFEGEMLRKSIVSGKGYMTRSEDRSEIG